MRPASLLIDTTASARFAGPWAMFAPRYTVPFGCTSHTTVIGSYWELWHRHQMGSSPEVERVRGTRLASYCWYEGGSFVRCHPGKQHRWTHRSQIAMMPGSSMKSEPGTHGVPSAGETTRLGSTRIRRTGKPVPGICWFESSNTARHTAATPAHSV